MRKTVSKGMESYGKPGGEDTAPSETPGWETAGRKQSWGLRVPSGVERVWNQDHMGMTSLAKESGFYFRCSGKITVAFMSRLHLALVSQPGLVERASQGSPLCLGSA